ncbi:hypothetical protein OPT61_g4425 [Boeremia exigua]|uniref:Uncharacterized protein n=1 Tax=Boeremia exigua TaxID=749465 RepID=A0ACC2IE22_9PLEO|nr:hypothetical protein OPT61_g4425 [Boeremia exigua]
MNVWGGSLGAEELQYRYATGGPGSYCVVERRVDTKPSTGRLAEWRLISKGGSIRSVAGGQSGSQSSVLLTGATPDEQQYNFRSETLLKMHASIIFSILPLLATTFAAPVDDVKRAVSATCPSYTIINTRGTGEAQGPSSGFRTMNTRVTGALSGGKIYNTVYAAGFSQNSAAGTTDIVNKVNSVLRTNPNECFILEGYSQGAQATVNALPRLTGASFSAVKGVFLIGNPAHKAGLTCNVDNNGGTTTRNVNGLSGRTGTGIPSTWVSKTLDVCIFGDGVCDTTNGNGINGPHLRYGSDTATQNLGSSFIQKQLA